MEVFVRFVVKKYKYLSNCMLIFKTPINGNNISFLFYDLFQREILLKLAVVVNTLQI